MDSVPERTGFKFFETTVGNTYRLWHYFHGCMSSEKVIESSVFRDRQHFNVLRTQIDSGPDRGISFSSGTLLRQPRRCMRTNQTPSLGGSSNLVKQGRIYETVVISHPTTRCALHCISGTDKVPPIVSCLFGLYCRCEDHNESRSNA